MVAVPYVRKYRTKKLETPKKVKKPQGIGISGFAAVLFTKAKVT